MNLKGSKTEVNLNSAFSGESQARNKYTYYASVAKKEGYEYIAQVFQRIADNEKEHAKIWFKHLSKIGNTIDNLADAIAGEKYESTSMYEEFAKTADDEGFHDIAQHFRLVGAIENEHKKEFEDLLVQVKDNVTFCSGDGKPCVWKCMNCGHIYFGTQAPVECPVCSHPQSYFKKGIVI